MLGSMLCSFQRLWFMQKLFQAAGPDDTAEVGSVDADYQRWKDSYGRQFYEFYGMVSPRMGTANMTWNGQPLCCHHAVEWFKAYMLTGVLWKHA